MGQIALIIRLSNVSTADLPTIRQQFQNFLVTNAATAPTNLPAALLAANPTTQVTIAVDKSSTYAETF